MENVSTIRKPKFSNKNSALFVTWNICTLDSKSLIEEEVEEDDGDGQDEEERYQLRGCIGNFAPQPIISGLKDYAIIAGTQDPRFPPIKAKDFSRLKVKVSLLEDFTEIPYVPLDKVDKDLDVNNNLDFFYNRPHLSNWEVGVHGIKLKLVLENIASSKSKLSKLFKNHIHKEENNNESNDRVSKKRKYKVYSSTFLPEVASEQGWTKKETIKHLLQKSGFNDKISPFVLDSIRLTTYISTISTLSFNEYKKDLIQYTDKLKSIK